MVTAPSSQLFAPMQTAAAANEGPGFDPRAFAFAQVTIPADVGLSVTWVVLMLPLAIGALLP
jgi:hypothetical protein